MATRGYLMIIRKETEAGPQWLGSLHTWVDTREQAVQLDSYYLTDVIRECKNNGDDLTALHTEAW